MNKNKVDILTGLIILAACAYIFKLDGLKFNIIVMIIAIKGIVILFHALNLKTNIK